MELPKGSVTLVFIFLISDVFSLTMDKVVIEKEGGKGPVKEGSNVCLKCLFDKEEKESIEGVRWFKDNVPFSIFTNSNADAYVGAEVPETDIDADVERTSNSEMNHLYVNDLKGSDSGNYKCEVITRLNKDRYKDYANADLKILPGTPWYQRFWWKLTGTPNTEDSEQQSNL